MGKAIFLSAIEMGNYTFLNFSICNRKDEFFLSEIEVNQAKGQKLRYLTLFMRIIKYAQIMLIIL